MIRLMRFTRFRVLQDTTLRPGPLTLLIGPNGSGKSTVLGALELLKLTCRMGDRLSFSSFPSQEWRFDQLASAALTVNIFSELTDSEVFRTLLFKSDAVERNGVPGHSKIRKGETVERLLGKVVVFNLDADAISQPATLSKDIRLSENGSNLAGVLDQLRDSHPERFEELNRALNAWLPEFDRILFSVPADGQRAFELRQKNSKRAIPAKLLSQGTRIALFLLTLAYLPSPPPIIGLEEPDRGLHPRLLKDVRDALYRLAYPDRFGEERDPVQVFATTHSPYFLDLFRDHPEQIVVCDKKGEEATFTPLSEMPHLEDILGDSHLGEAWFTGVLGGVPAGT